ncbi:MAG: hypothetical protein V5A39_05160 [Haloarculaceae archaeon]
MVGIGEVLLGGVLAVVCVWAVHRLAVVARAFFALRGTPTTDAAGLTDGQPVAVEGPVFVDEPAGISERLFAPEVGLVGAYIWHTWFPDVGRYTYDFDRGELRKGRSTFASGIEVGRMGVTTGGRPLYIDFSWLRQIYDSDDLSELEVGNPVRNAKLPTIVTRYVWDGIYVSLTSTIGDCSMDRLTDIVDLYRDDVATEEFNVESRGITAGEQLFVHGELRVRDGEYTIVGTDQTPLLVSDTRRGGLIQQLRWRALKYTMALLAAAAFGALFIR